MISPMDPELQRIGQLFTDRMEALASSLDADAAFKQWVFFFMLVMHRNPDENLRRSLEPVAQLVALDAMADPELHVVKE